MNVLWSLERDVVGVFDGDFVLPFIPVDSNSHDAKISAKGYSSNDCLRNLVR